MSKKLVCSALLKFFAGAATTGLLVFLPAGTLAFRRGWLFMALLFIPMLFAGLVMLAQCPELLAKRLNAKEKQSKQKQVIALSGLMFVGGFVLAGLDFRFQWLQAPAAVTGGAAVVFLAAYLLYAEVLRENAYLSRTIEIQESQKVVDTGLYGIVRHPMYAVTLLLFLMIPLVLGSFAALPVFLLYPFLLVKRIINEEQVLEEGLPGYREYEQRVRWRLVPLIW